MKSGRMPGKGGRAFLLSERRYVRVTEGQGGAIDVLTHLENSKLLSEQAREEIREKYLQAELALMTIDFPLPDELRGKKMASCHKIELSFLRKTKTSAGLQADPVSDMGPAYSGEQPAGDERSKESTFLLDDLWVFLGLKEPLETGHAPEKDENGVWLDKVLLVSPAE